MKEFMEIYEGARYSKDRIINSIKAGEKACFYLSSAMRKITQENITDAEILQILRMLHDVNDQLLIVSNNCEDASGELERKILCD